MWINGGVSWYIIWEEGTRTDVGPGRDISDCGAQLMHNRVVPDVVRDVDVFGVLNERCREMMV